MICEKCGKTIETGEMFCQHCGSPVPVQPVQETPQPEQAPVQQVAPVQKPENVVAGIVGALIGAAIGAAAIILLSQLGYVASISGLILAICTVKGYELLGGRLTIKGIIISLVLMLVTPYVADRLDWAIVLMNAYGDITLGEAFAAVPALIEEEVIAMSDYVKNLLMIYGFVALGAISTVANLFKKKK